MNPHHTITCSDGEGLYFLDMRFLMVSLTDFTFFPREIREGVGDLDASLMLMLPFSFCKTDMTECTTSKSSKIIKTACKKLNRFWNRFYDYFAIFQCVLTVGSKLLLPMYTDRLVRSNPPKLQVLCDTKHRVRKAKSGSSYIFTFNLDHTSYIFSE